MSWFASTSASDRPCPPSCKTVVLGNFDGVHLGHTALIRAALLNKKVSGDVCVVWTFTEPATHAPLITDLETRKALLLQAGADTVETADFLSVCRLSPEDFVKTILVDKLRADCVVCGFNYRFGKNAQGNAALLSELCSRYGMETKIVDAVKDGEGIPVSSTRIREKLQCGDMDGAAALLGRRYSYTLPVLDGRHVARTLDVPTANQLIPHRLVTPKYGVYAGLAHVDGAAYGCVCNIGLRPTYPGDNDTGVWSETHLFDFQGDLYGKQLCVTPLRYLRDETPFSSLETLKEAIAKDMADARAWLEKHRSALSVR